MALSEKITCDVCAIERGPSNHWLLYNRKDDRISFYIWAEHYPGFGHLCGQACAAKLLSRSVDSWQKEAPTA